MDLRVSTDPAGAAATAIERRLGAALRERPFASLALSGGSTAPPMIARLIECDLDWDRIGIWQVDERVAPDGDPGRNANQLVDLPGAVHLMPVTDNDLVAAADTYSRGLPVRFDVVHLGLGDDGHTASWPPDQPDVPRRPTPVTTTTRFNGFDRMTLTRAVVNDAECRIVLTVGASKAPMVKRWLDGDPDLPISLVTPDDTAAFLDADAASESLGRATG